MPADTVSNRSVVILVTLSALVVSLVMMIWGGEPVVGQSDVQPIDPETILEYDNPSVPPEGYRGESSPNRR